MIMVMVVLINMIILFMIITLVNKMMVRKV